MSTKKPTVNKLHWEKYPYGGEVAKYKMGTIVKYKGNYQISYFGTIGMVVKHATSLTNAKNKLDVISKEKAAKQGLKKPVTKGLTTFCAKTVGVSGRRKKDGTLKKNHVATKGGKVVAVKKKTTARKK